MDTSIDSLSIGILALHGAFREHKVFLLKLYPNLTIIFVKHPDELLQIDGLMFRSLLLNNFLKIS